MILTRQELYKTLYDSYYRDYLNGRIEDIGYLPVKTPEQQTAIKDKASRQANIYAVKNTEWVYQLQFKKD